NFVGKEQPIYDLVPIVTGKAQFGADIVRDGMVYASIEHPPVVGGKVKSVDTAETMKVRGVSGTEQLDPITPPTLFKPLGGVAVIGANTWSVLQGRKKLKIAWEDGPNGTFDSEQFKQQMQATAKQPAKVVARNLGNVDAEFAK